MTGGQTLTGMIVVLGLAGAGITYSALFSPEPVDELAVSAASNTEMEPADVAATIADPSGRWIVQGGSQAGYRVREKLVNFGAPRDAVGRTDAVTGGLTVEAEGQDYTVEEIEILVDVSKLVSDDALRDEAMKTRGLQTDRFPTARFEAGGPISLPTRMASGKTLELTLEGRLTIREVTRHVSIPIEARLRDDRAEVVGSFTFPMLEFGIVPPHVVNVVTVEPTATMEFRLLLAKAA